MSFQLYRVYDPDIPEEGLRVLIDRLWPRGVRKDVLRLDHWLKDIAPSPELRKWFCHKEERFDEFAASYRYELETDPAHKEACDAVITWSKEQPVFLLYGAKDPVHNHARVLEAHLKNLVI